MRLNYKKILIVIVASVIGVGVYASGDSTRRVTHGLALDFRPGAVLHSNSFLSGENEWNKSANTSLGVHLKYRFSFGESTKAGRMYKGAYLCLIDICRCRRLNRCSSGGSPVQ